MKLTVRTKSLHFSVSSTKHFNLPDHSKWKAKTLLFSLKKSPWNNPTTMRIEILRFPKASIRFKTRFHEKFKLTSWLRDCKRWSELKFVVISNIIALTEISPKSKLQIRSKERCWSLLQRLPFFSSLFVFGGGVNQAPKPGKHLIPQSALCRDILSRWHLLYKYICQVGSFW